MKSLQLYLVDVIGFQVRKKENVEFRQKKRKVRLQLRRAFQRRIN